MLTLKIDSNEIPGRAYARAVRAFVNIIESVADDMAQTPGAVETFVTVSSGGARLHVVTVAREDVHLVAEEVVEGVFRGLDQIEKRGERPANFPNDVLFEVRALSSILKAPKNPVNGISIQANGKTLVMSVKSAANVDLLLAKDYQDFGTIEGKLQTITERRGVRIYVFDDLTDRKIICQIQPDLRDAALAFFGKRVEARGLIRYRADGDPVSIRVEDLSVLEPDGNLPRPDEVLGIFGRG